MRMWLFVVAVLAVIVAIVWTSDKVTLEGQRTVYTVSCRDGSWQGTHCTGRLVAADRYRFRALKPHREVVFWIVGSTQPSGKFTDCAISDGRNWLCKSSDAARDTITLQMDHGSPVHDTTGLAKPFHAVAKPRWYLLRWGLPIGNDSDE